MMLALMSLPEENMLHWITKSMCKVNWTWEFSINLNSNFLSLYYAQWIFTLIFRIIFVFNIFVRGVVQWNSSAEMCLQNVVYPASTRSVVCTEINDQCYLKIYYYKYYIHILPQFHLFFLSSHWPLTQIQHNTDLSKCTLKWEYLTYYENN